MAESKLTQVSLLAGRAAEYLSEENRRAYTEIEKQCAERFPEHLELFHILVNSDLKSLDQVGESDPFDFRGNS